MKSAEIYSVETEKAPGYGWKWRSADGKVSKDCFLYYHDCLASARKSGYQVELKSTGTNRPGGDAPSSAMR